MVYIGDVHKIFGSRLDGELRIFGSYLQASESAVDSDTRCDLPFSCFVRVLQGVRQIGVRKTERDPILLKNEKKPKKFAFSNL